MTASDSTSYFSHLDKLVDKNTYHHSIAKKLLMLIILLWLKKLTQIIKLGSLKLMTESKLLGIRLHYTENWSREKFIDSVFKTNPWTYKIKDLNREK